MTTKVELTPHDVNCVAHALDVRACAKAEGVDPEAWIKAGGPLGAAMSETGIAEDLARYARGTELLHRYRLVETRRWLCPQSIPGIPGAIAGEVVPAGYVGTSQVYRRRGLVPRKRKPEEVA